MVAVEACASCRDLWGLTDLALWLEILALRSRAGVSLVALRLVKYPRFYGDSLST